MRREDIRDGALLDSPSPDRDIRVVMLAREHFGALHGVIDEVARETRSMSELTAPPVETLNFYLGCMLEQGWPGFVALRGASLVGWCDAQPDPAGARRHVGVVSIALLQCARGRGIGQQLLAATIGRSWAIGLTRLELTVRADNVIAHRLYERTGFRYEGRQIGGQRIDGVYHDCFSMALLRDAIPHGEKHGDEAACR